MNIATLGPAYNDNVRFWWQEYLKNYGGEDEEDETEGGMVQLGSDTGFFLHKDLMVKLYNHQKEGVLWLWCLHKKNKGGILGDDMGWVSRTDLGTGTRQCDGTQENHGMSEQLLVRLTK